MSNSIHDSRDNKPKGWFSRRHQTSNPHEDARATYLANHGRAARKERAEGYLVSLAQVAVLDARLGAGVGAKRERARLAAA